MIKIQAHTKGAGFRPFWFAPLGSLPHWETPVVTVMVVAGASCFGRLSSRPLSFLTKCAMSPIDAVDRSSTGT